MFPLWGIPFPPLENMQGRTKCFLKSRSLKKIRIAYKWLCKAISSVFKLLAFSLRAVLSCRFRCTLWSKGPVSNSPACSLIHFHIFKTYIVFSYTRYNNEHHIKNNNKELCTTLPTVYLLCIIFRLKLMFPEPRAIVLSSPCALVQYSTVGNESHEGSFYLERPLWLRFFQASHMQSIITLSCGFWNGSLYYWARPRASDKVLIL